MIDNDCIEMTADLVTLAGETIAKYNKSLAQMWARNPFQRSNIATAFEAGFASANNDTIQVQEAAQADAFIRKCLAE